MSQSITGPKGLAFHTRTWKAEEEKAVLVLVHGFVEHIGRYDDISKAFNKKGITVFGYDQRGFGQTATETSYAVTSWKDQFEDIDFFLNYVHENVSTAPLFLMGHSMGGGLVLGYNTRDKRYPHTNLLKGVVASAPLLRQAAVTRAPLWQVKLGSVAAKVLPRLKIPSEVPSDYVSRIPEEQKIYAEDPLCKNFGTARNVSDMLLGGLSILNKDYKNWDKALPLLIVHGTGDKLTDSEASSEFIGKLKKAGVSDASITLYPDAAHELHHDLDREKEFADVSGWIISHINGLSTVASNSKL